jgi:hypothetical protein
MSLYLGEEIGGLLSLETIELSSDSTARLSGRSHRVQFFEST